MYRCCDRTLFLSDEGLWDSQTHFEPNGLLHLYSTKEWQEMGFILKTFYFKNHSATEKHDFVSRVDLGCKVGRQSNCWSFDIRLIGNETLHSQFETSPQTQYYVAQLQMKKKNKAKYWSCVLSMISSRIRTRLAAVFLIEFQVKLFWKRQVRFFNTTSHPFPPLAHSFMVKV